MLVVIRYYNGFFSLKWPLRPDGSGALENWSIILSRPESAYFGSLGYGEVLKFESVNVENIFGLRLSIWDLDCRSRLRLLRNDWF